MQESSPVRRVAAIIGMVFCGLIVAAIASGTASDFLGFISWPVRGMIGHTLFVAAVAGMLLFVSWSGRRGRWKPPEIANSDTSSNNVWLIRLAPFVMHGLLATLAIPLLAKLDCLGFGDWDHHLQKYEAARQSILSWGQIPWWNPWCRGGFPLAAEPEFGLGSVAMPLVLLFGTGPGLRIAALVHVALAAEGTRRLAARWFADPLAALMAGFIYSLNGAITVYMAAGYFIPMSFFALPWLVYFAQKLELGRVNGLWLGVWVSLSICSGIQYPTVFGCVILLFIWLARLAVVTALDRRTYLTSTLMAMGIILFLSSWRIISTGAVILDYPREHTSLVDLPLDHWYRVLMNRPGFDRLMNGDLDQLWESGAYVGPAVCVLVILSLTQGCRWWHLLIVITFWLAVGVYRWYQPSYWLNDGWPMFASIHKVERWRVVGMLGVALSAAAGVRILNKSTRRWVRLLAWPACFCLVADLLHYAHTIYPITNSIASIETSYPGEAVTSPTNLEYWETSGTGGKSFNQLMSFAATLRGYGVIRSHEVLLGYNRNDKTARTWRDNSGYVGEYWIDDEFVEPQYWSPNRIVFQLDPGEALELNVNPGSWWSVNGERPFATSRCAEWNERFVVNANEAGQLELVVKPPFIKWIILGTVLGWMMLMAAWWIQNRKGRLV